MIIQILQPMQERITALTQITQQQKRTPMKAVILTLLKIIITKMYIVMTIIMTINILLVSEDLTALIMAIIITIVIIQICIGMIIIHIPGE
jgi:hypothetical protein